LAITVTKTEKCELLMAIFTGKIYCNLCKKPFKRKLERDTYRWICQSYDNKQSCERLKVEEDWLINLVSMRLFWDEKEQLEKFIQQELDHIVFESKYRVVVKFKNSKYDDMILYDGKISYGENVRMNDVG
jgi:hypothetical protein